MPGTTETLWTGFNGRKVGAERAKKDEKGRDIADSIDKIPSTYVSSASVSGQTLSMTLTDQSTSPATTTSMSLDVLIPIDSTNYDKAENIVVVSALPSTRDAHTIYLVPETLT